jgi:hypothetical protein
MPVPQLPYKRPFFTITLNPHEIEVRAQPRWQMYVVGRSCDALDCDRMPLRGCGSLHTPPPTGCSRLTARLLPCMHTPPSQEDLALIITNTKRAGRVPRRVTPPPERRNGGAGRDDQ